MSAYDWYAIRIRPTHRLEFIVQSELNQREHPAMVPFEMKWEKHKGKRKPRRYALMPCYVFGQFCSYRDFWLSKEAINQRAIDIGKSPPIVGLVGMGSKPAVLSPRDVSMIQALSLAGPTEISLHKALRAGARASIVGRGHPFEGHTVTVDTITRNKCRVLLEFLGSLKTVEIDAGALEAA
jgi:hypothetical protein